MTSSYDVQYYRRRRVIEDLLEDTPTYSLLSAYVVDSNNTALLEDS